MNEMSWLAIKVGMVFVLSLGIAAAPEVSKAALGVSSEQGSAWVCQGRVAGCDKVPHEDGVSGGCRRARGTGADRARAMSGALGDCQSQLHASPGGAWSCSDTSGLSCETEGVGR